MYIIYYIYHNELLLYIGSTTNFNKRKIDHKSDCYNKKKRHYNLNLYQYIRDNNIIFEDLIWESEETDIIDKNQAHKYEGSKILELNPLYNYQIAGRSKKEYDKQWKENNKEYHKQYYKQWIENNKEKKTEQNRQWYEKNKEKKTEQNRQYREVNREWINERRRLKYHEKKNETKIE